MQRFYAVILVLTAFALHPVAVASQEKSYADTIDREARRQGVRPVPCDPDAKNCTGKMVPKIVNGRRAELGMFPWSVSIGKSGAENFLGHQCGGTLISERFILTAAHCFLDTARPEDYRIQIGTVELGGYRDKAAIKAIRLHKSFNRATNEADVALLELGAPVAKSDTIEWLPVQDQSAFDQSGHESSGNRVLYTLTGFGFVAPGARPVRLQYADNVPSLTTAECHELKVWNKSVFGEALTPDMICAGNTNNVIGSDACKGDSGGGLILPQDGMKAVVAGIVSRGALPDGSLDCTQQPLRVGVYTRVSAYAEQIDACIGGPGSCDFVPPGRQLADIRE
ncbi:serine protease (plasmid) [Rhizobium johnstonii]|nr:serine protease [Rhizobium johnstonii]